MRGGSIVIIQICPSQKTVTNFNCKHLSLELCLAMASVANAPLNLLKPLNLPRYKPGIGSGFVTTPLRSTINAPFLTAQSSKQSSSPIICFASEKQNSSTDARQVTLCSLASIFLIQSSTFKYLLFRLM